MNQDGASTGSPSYQIYPGVNPPAPTGLTAAGANGSVNLSWTTSSPGEDFEIIGYAVFRAETSGGPYELVSPGYVSSNSYTDSGLTDGTTYYYVVVEIDSQLEYGGYSNEASATPSVTNPVLCGALPGDGTVALAWTYGFPAVYNVYRSTASGGPYSLVAASPVNGTSFTDTGLNDGEAYYYVVTALDGATESGYSNQLSATPTSTPPIPLLTATGYAGEALLQWTPVPGATGYDLSRATVAGGPYSAIAAQPVPAQCTAYVDDGLNDGTQYHYIMQAAFGSEVAPSTPEATATPSGPVIFAVNPANLYILPGVTAASSLDILNQSGFADTLSFSILGTTPLPTAASAFFYPVTATSEGSVLDVLVGPSTPTGSTTLSVQGYDSVTGSAYIKLLAITNE